MIILFLWAATCATARGHAGQNENENGTEPEYGAQEPGAKPSGAAVSVEIDAEGLITLSAESEDARIVLTELADAVRMPVIVDDSVARRLTVYLAHMTLEEILRSISVAYGLSIRDENGTIVVTDGLPETPASYLGSEIGFIQARHVKASDVILLLPQYLRQYVRSNDDQNSVVISAPPDVLQRVRDGIRGFDVPSPQIAADILVVELTDTGAKELGLDARWANLHNLATSDTGLGELTYSTLGSLPASFSATLRALVKSGKARVRAMPRIVTVNGAPASVFSGRQVYLENPIQGGVDENYGTSYHIDSGVTFKMTPWTGGGGEIIMHIEPEISTLSSKDPETGLPDVSTRSAETTLRVRDGDTVVIGGLTQHETRKVKQKMPFFGDLPIVGPAFRRGSTEEVTTQLVIFITPHVVAEDRTKDRQLKDDLIKKLEGGR
jgi:type II secretory pathway component GspD/PulD (secretin)